MCERPPPFDDACPFSVAWDYSIALLRSALAWSRASWLTCLSTVLSVVILGPSRLAVSNSVSYFLKSGSPLYSLEYFASTFDICVSVRRGNDTVSRALRSMIGASTFDWRRVATFLDILLVSCGFLTSVGNLISRPSAWSH